MTAIAHFEIEHNHFLESDGRLAAELPKSVASSEDLVPLYRNMVLTRRFDQQCIALQRTGRLGTYASSLGQEAIGTGVGAAMDIRDVLLPSYREHGAQLWRGTTVEELLLYWGGDERGSNFSGPLEDFPVCIPIATQCTHATGVATAFKVRRQPRVAVAMCGDGATSKGDFYEAVNLAGAWQLPVIFVVTNNQWAISVPRGRQTSAETLAQKAIAGGLPGEQVDGNDVVAVYDAMSRALARHRDLPLQLLDAGRDLLADPFVQRDAQLAAGLEIRHEDAVVAEREHQVGDEPIDRRPLGVEVAGLFVDRQVDLTPRLVDGTVVREQLAGPVEDARPRRRQLFTARTVPDR